MTYSTSMTWQNDHTVSSLIQANSHAVEMLEWIEHMRDLRTACRLRLHGVVLVMIPSHLTLLTLLHCALNKAPSVHSSLTIGNDCTRKMSITVHFKLADNMMIVIWLDSLMLKTQSMLIMYSQHMCAKESFRIQPPTNFWIFMYQ